MPLVNFDLVKGRSEEEVRELLSVCHRVFVSALEIPEGDRYQVVRQHEEYELVMEDTDLGFERSKQRVLISITSRSRTRKQKEVLYKSLQETLERELGLDPRDLMVNFTINNDEDWSFAYGKAQFLTGELS